ncbi:MAG: hypothetical protein M5U34_44945 [Chloroflexi bacterium]|nr:hypothetical protein [Chloroflexota bacterium]
MLLQRVWETPGAYDQAYMMDWFAMQIHLGILTPAEAEEQRQLYELYRDWRVYKDDFWPGRDTSWAWPERVDAPSLTNATTLIEPAGLTGRGCACGRPVGPIACWMAGALAPLRCWP